MLKDYIKKIIDENYGKREIRVVCPECGYGEKDKTLSIRVSEEFYRCFRCGIKGNVSDNETVRTEEIPTEKQIRYYLDNSVSAKDRTHPYLKKKGVIAHKGIRLYDKKNLLLVPAMDTAGTIKTLQRIYPEKIEINGKPTDKLFLRNTTGKPIIKGCFFKISASEPNTRKAYLTEGYATGASVFDAIGCAADTYSCFNAGNISDVLDVIYDSYNEIIICADNDHKQEKNPKKPDNPGKRYAIAAASQYDNVKITYPIGIKGSDFNDMQIEKGIDAVKDRIAEARRHCPPKKEISFWYETINSKGEAILNINHSQLLRYIESKGVFNSEFQKEKILVRKMANILEIIQIDDIRNYLIKEWLPELPYKISENKSRSELEEILTKGIYVYVQPAKIEILERKQINILKDTEKETFFHFRNGIIKISASGIEKIGYDKIEGDIWADSINNHHIKIENSLDSIYGNFIFNLSGDSRDRYDAICTAHGYLLNRYNNPAYPKAVILSDGIIDDTPNGGTGKGIIAQALSYLRIQAYIDGKTTDMRNTFALQNINLQTEIVLFDDVGKNFSLETLFSNITNGYSVEKKNKNRFSFSPDENPKTLITTNYAIKGTGHSFERRKEEIELFPYYGQNGKKPDDDFGTLFIWDAKEWNKFYNFMFQCVQMYHQNGNRIADFQSETLNLKKTITETGISFFEFAEDIPIDEWIITSEYYEKYLVSISKRERDFMSSNKFGRLLSSYCKGKGIILEKKKVNGKKRFKINKNTD